MNCAWLKVYWSSMPPDDIPRFFWYRGIPHIAIADHPCWRNDVLSLRSCDVAYLAHLLYCHDNLRPYYWDIHLIQRYLIKHAVAISVVASQDLCNKKRKSVVRSLPPVVHWFLFYRCQSARTTWNKTQIKPWIVSAFQSCFRVFNTLKNKSARTCEIKLK